MDNPFVDLHVHSYYSDGSLSPQEIVEAAVENRVGLLAVADHNVLEGGRLAGELCRRAGIRCVPAAEIDTLDGDVNFHILAYGFDGENREFTDFLRHTRFLLDESSVKLVEKMQGDYADISIADFMDFTYDRRLGGWKALHYLMEKGLTSSLKEGIGFYRRYDMRYRESGYSTIGAAAYRIRAAGGYCVLAHPGELIDSADMVYFTRELRRIVAMGVDGVECYYPSHSPAVTDACISICREEDLLITAGSDCHGAFGGARVGEMDSTVDRLSLKNLLAGD